MKTKNKIKTALLLALSTGILAAGSFAFFSDKKDSTQTAKIGTLELEYGSQIAHQNGLNNINPGDNDKTVPKDNRPGTDHELLIRTKNKGTKSAVVKHIIKVNATKNGKPVQLISDEGRKLLLFTPTEKETLDDIGDSSKQKENRGMGNFDPINFKFNKDFTSMYYASPEYPLNGTEEIDAAKDEIAKVYDLGLSRFAENEFAGADINIEIQTLAMQYRNTGKGEWTKIFKDELTIKQDPIPGEDEKPSDPNNKPEMIDEETAEMVDTSYAFAEDSRFRIYINYRVFIDPKFNKMPQNNQIKVVYTKKEESPDQGIISSDMFDIDKVEDGLFHLYNSTFDGMKEFKNKGYDVHSIDSYVELDGIDGNKRYIPTHYEATYQLDLRLDTPRKGQKYVYVSTDIENTDLKITVMRNGVPVYTESFKLLEKGKHYKLQFTNNFRLQTGDIVKYEGIAFKDGNKHTSNPYVKAVRN